jgi:hypothetical protein
MVFVLSALCYAAFGMVRDSLGWVAREFPMKVGQATFTVFLKRFRRG